MKRSKFCIGLVGATGGLAFAATASNLLTMAEIKLFKSLATIGYAKSDDRLATRQNDVARAARYFNQGRFAESVKALDQAEAAAPVEVSDFATWPLRDIIACRKAPAQSNRLKMSDCAFAFETGAATCAKVAHLNKVCVQYYCTSEILVPAYEKPHKSYLTASQTRDLRSAIQTVNRFCKK